jgi:hypothetical protein
LRPLVFIIIPPISSCLNKKDIRPAQSFRKPINGFLGSGGDLFGQVFVGQQELLKFDEGAHDHEDTLDADLVLRSQVVTGSKKQKRRRNVPTP